MTPAAWVQTPFNVRMLEAAAPYDVSCSLRSSRRK